MTDNITRATFYEGLTSASILFDRLCSENEALHAALERIMYDHGTCGEDCAEAACAFLAARPLLRDGWRERQERALEERTP